MRHLHELAQRAPVSGNCTLLVDSTGVGAPVVDLLRTARPGCRIIPMTITDGDQEGSDGTLYHVPKRDLLTDLQVVIEQRRLEIASKSRSERLEYRWGLIMRFERISANPAVATGKPCIRDLRFPVSRLLGLLAAGETRESILESYPYLEPEDITEALRYAAYLAEDETVELAR